MPAPVIDAGQLVPRALRLLATRGPGPAGRQVVAVDGPSGAGKTTLASALAAGLGAQVIHLDDVYPGWDGLEDGVRRIVTGVLAPLAAGADVLTLHRWDWTADGDGEPQQVPAATLTVLEGVGAGARTCRPYLSALIWVDAPEPLRRVRALARDGPEYERNWDRWAAQERAHFAREGTRTQADLVVRLGGN